MAQWKESVCNAGATGDVGLIPGWGRSPGEGNSNPLQYSCLENHEQRSLVGYSPQCCKESDTTEVTLHACPHGKKPNEPFGQPLEILTSCWIQAPCYSHGCPSKSKEIVSSFLELLAWQKPDQSPETSSTIAGGSMLWMCLGRGDEFDLENHRLGAQGADFRLQVCL